MVYQDTFDAGTLNSFWTLQDEPASYASGGGATIPGNGWLRFNSVGNNAYANIRSADTLDTTNGIRVDAVMRQDSSGTSTFAMSVSIYYGVDNWVSLRMGNAGGQMGWMKDVFIGGVRTSQMGDYFDFRNWNKHAAGIEITDTQIKFLGAYTTDDVTNMAVIDAFTMVKPTGFTGLGTVIIGKGISGDFGGSGNYPNPYFQNSGSSDNHQFNGVDYARVTVIPEPATLLLLMGGSVALLRRKR